MTNLSNIKLNNWWNVWGKITHTDLACFIIY